MTAEPRTDSGWWRLAKALLLAAPALWTALLIWRNGVDVPWYDQWDGTCPLFEKMAAGTLGLGDFFAQHSEHRIFFPRLLTFALARLTHWNVRAELGMIWLLAVVMAGNLWQVRRITGSAGSRGGFWLLFAAFVLLFTPLQYENWLWGFQIGFMLPLACVTACVWLAPSLRAPASFLVTMGLCTVSTFSIASGFGCWLLCLPLLWFHPDGGGWARRKFWWLLWLGVFAANLVVYFHGYEKPSYHPSMLEPFRQPGLALHYSLAYLGAPFGFGSVFNPTTVAPVAGAALLLVLGLCAGYVLWQRRDAGLRARTLPWLMLSLVAVFNGALTTVGRMGLPEGVSQALTSRYATFAIMLPIGLLFAGAAVFQHWRNRAPERSAGAGRTLAILITALALLHALGSIASLDTWSALHRRRLTTKSLVMLINQVDEPEELAGFVHAIVPPLRDRANVLDHLGYLRPGLVKTPFASDLADPAAPAGARYGELQQAGRTPDGQLAVTGWAVLPGQQGPANAVLLTYDDIEGRPRLFALAVVGSPRSDIAGTLQDDRYLESGWGKVFRPGQLPLGRHVIRAWAFDAETGHAYALAGATTLQP